MEQRVGAIIPLVLREGMSADIFTHFPAHIYKRKLDIVFLLVARRRFVEQEEQVPIGIVMEVATGT